MPPASRRRLDAVATKRENQGMAQRLAPFAVDEWYHCFSRGVEKRRIFFDARDYNRFLHALYLCNSDISIHRSNLRGISNADILNTELGSPLVAIGAYCLMPNHFHLLIKEIVEGGISMFMQKVGTAYSMYFNIKYEHSGSLLAKPFKSKHISDDRYLKRVIQYIHLNPVELFERSWKRGIVNDKRGLQNKIEQYRYSSLVDYRGDNRDEKVILAGNEMEFLIGDEEVSPGEVLEEMSEYYEEIGL
jgi:putative transposase